MTIDLKAMNVAELEALQGQIAEELEARRRDERQSLIEEFRSKAKALGISMEELMGARKGKARAAKGAAKFAHPEDASLTWSGKGKRPRWLNEWLASGKSMDDLKV